MDLKHEVRRLADIAQDRHGEAEDRVQRAAKDGEAYTPFMLEQVVATQLNFSLWERTRHYVIEGAEGNFVIGADRLSDTDDPKAALRNLLEGIAEPTPYRQGAPWPMDEAFHALEKREYNLWSEACGSLLAKADGEQAVDGAP